MLDDLLLSILLESEMLGLKEFVRVHQLLKKPWKMLDYVLKCRPEPCGRNRFLQWKYTLSLILSTKKSEEERERTEYFRIRSDIVPSISEITNISGGTEGEIMRDVVRTFQKEVFFQQGQPGHEMLLHVLYVFVRASPHIGYCQGMNYVAAALLLGRTPAQYSNVQSSTTGVQPTSSTHHQQQLAAQQQRLQQQQQQQQSQSQQDPQEVLGDSQQRGQKGDVEGELAAAGGVPSSSTTELDQQQSGDDKQEAAQGNGANTNTAAAVVALSSEEMDAIEADAYLMMREMVRTQNDVGSNGVGCKLDMAGLWKERIPKLKLRIYQLDRLLKWTYPQLHAHFVSIQLSPEVLATQWFITLFTYTFPVVPTVLRLWDYVFLTGWEGLFRVALSLLGSLKAQLLELEDFEGVVMLMREWKREGRLVISESTGELLRRAEEYVINQEVLGRLQEAFASEILSIALLKSTVVTTNSHTHTTTITPDTTTANTKANAAANITFSLSLKNLSGGSSALQQLHGQGPELEDTGSTAGNLTPLSRSAFGGGGGSSSTKDKEGGGVTSIHKITSRISKEIKGKGKKLNSLRPKNLLKPMNTSKKRVSVTRTTVGGGAMEEEEEEEEEEEPTAFWAVVALVPLVLLLVLLVEPLTMEAMPATEPEDAIRGTFGGSRPNAGATAAAATAE